MDKLYLGTNLKMYKTSGETLAYLKELVSCRGEFPLDRLELFVIPSYTALEKAGEFLNGFPVTLGAQNMAWEDKGQFTGEISAPMLKELGVTLVMLGHSERRHVFGETDEMLRRKVKAAAGHGFQTLLCVGETAAQKAAGVNREILRMQIKQDLSLLPEGKERNLKIAYEPVWAIGTAGTPAASEYVQEQHRVIRECLYELFGKTADEIPILYGGSVNPENAPKLIQLPNVDGLFIGRSAWNAKKFQEMIRDVAAVWPGRDAIQS